MSMCRCKESTKTVRREGPSACRQANVEQSIVHDGQLTFCLGANTKGCSTNTQSWYSAYAGTCMANAHGRPFCQSPGNTTKFFMLHSSLATEAPLDCTKEMISYQQEAPPYPVSDNRCQLHNGCQVDEIMIVRAHAAQAQIRSTIDQLPSWAIHGLCKAQEAT